MKHFSLYIFLSCLMLKGKLEAYSLSRFQNPISFPKNNPMEKCLHISKDHFSPDMPGTIALNPMFGVLLDFRNLLKL